MSGLALIPVLLRELVASETFPREPEPHLVMDDPVQVKAYGEAGRIDGVMAASYLFHSARSSQVIQGCGAVLDLGCGPATQLAQIAQLNPAIHFTGVDLSAGMLADAEKYTKGLNLENVSFREVDITTLAGIADRSMDAVISTMALHHLPSLQHLENCFRAIRRVLRPGGALYLTDFGRLKSLRSMLFFAYMNAPYQPHVFSLDYERSLRAAFLKEDFAAAARNCLSQDVELRSTFKVPLLVILKTADMALPAAMRTRFIAMRKSFQPRYRRDLDMLRFFFWLDGLKNDPFA